jgi:amino acid permease
VSLVSITAMAGAAARSSSVIMGRGRFARLVEEHLGRYAAKASAISSLLLWFGIIVVYVLGFGTTLSEVVGGRAVLWSLGVGAVVIAVVTTNARRLFVRAASSVATVNVVLLFVLIVLCLMHFRTSLFSHIGSPDIGGSIQRLVQRGFREPTFDTPTTLPPVAGASSFRQTLDLVFGTALFVYAGQTALFSVAPEVLRADPSGRALVRGSQYAIIAAMVVNAGWVVVVLSAVPGKEFLELRSLGVALIGGVIGGPFKLIASTVVLLGFGVGAVNAAFASADIVTERLPNDQRLEAVLRPGVMLEVQEPALDLRLTITAVDEDGRLALIARARSGDHTEWMFISGDHWEADALLTRFGKVPKHRWLHLEVVGESPVGVAVRAHGTMAIEYFPSVDAVWWKHELGGLELRVVQQLVRETANEAQLAERLGVDRSAIDVVVGRLFEAHAVTRGDRGEVRPVLGRRHRARSALVANLYADLTGETLWSSQHSTSRLSSPFVKVLLRGLIAAAPIGTVVLLDALGIGFGRALGLVAIGTLVLLQGTLPVLLGLSLQRRAERRLPFARFRMPSWVVSLMVTFFLAVCVAYAVVIYRAALERVVATLSLLVCLSVVTAARRFGAFTRRTNITLEVAAAGEIEAYALVGGNEVEVSAPQRLASDARSLEISIDGPLVSPVTVRAISGDVAPGRLGQWQAIVVTGDSERSVASGMQMDVSGELIELSDEQPERVKVRWAVL